MFDLQQLPISAPALDEHRNYPLQIYTLGRFSVSRGLEPIRFTRKAQHRPLQLLKALIAFGGREVATDQLAVAMWPESEGDMAYNAFEITLHRLRRLIGIDKALVLLNGLLTLDNRQCWVDVWAFEQAAGRAEALLKTAHPNPEELAGVSSRVIALYHGHFLGRETPEPWSISLRERLRSTFLRHLHSVLPERARSRRSRGNLLSAPDGLLSAARAPQRSAGCLPPLSYNLVIDSFHSSFPSDRSHSPASDSSLIF